MYRCNDNIGCLYLYLHTELEKILNVESYKINTDIEISAKMIGVKPNIIASVIDTIPIVTCSLVCPLSRKVL